ncbi:thiamine-phosphate kinase [bacterium]|nr:thiamine-phosphate kinase [bacterium]
MNSEKPTLAQIGELEFINRIRSMMPIEGGTIIRSAGDDCLVTEFPGERLMLSTTDTFVDSVHFNPAWSDYHDIGCRCMAASVSDIAAMSGIPLYTLVSLSMPPGLFLDDAVSLFAGLSKTGIGYSCPVCGGETTSTPGPLTITVTVIGAVEPERMVTRSGAQAGDAVYVTGFLGDAMGGLLAFQHGEEGCDSLKKKFVIPEARVALSRSLTGTYRIGAMIDLSDGLASDLGHICEESRTGAVVDACCIPLSDDFLRLMEKHGRNPLDFALTAGEDFELLFTLRDPSLPAAGNVLGCPVTRIGYITGPSEGMSVRMRDGSVKTITVKGYEHFKS